MASKNAPKQWQLTTDETISTFEAWKDNLLYILEENDANELFLNRGASWKRSSEDSYRGYTDAFKDRNTRRLERMLGQIANFCPTYSRTEIIYESTCLEDVWSMLRTHYQLQVTGASILDFHDFKPNPGEKNEDLYQRLKVFLEGNLLSTTSKVKHMCKAIAHNEVMTPLLQNVLVAQWLHIIHPSLPGIVKQRYATVLRHNTLASIKPEISIALQSMIDELHSSEDGQVRRLNQQFRRSQPPRSQKFCSICKRNRRPYTSHDTFECRNAKPSRNRTVYSQDYEDVLDPEYTTYDNDMFEMSSMSALLDTPAARSVDIINSPYLDAYLGAQCVRITLDSGATSSFIKGSYADKIGLRIQPASQSARQADGETSLPVKGEVHCMLTRGDYSLQLDALVVDKLDTDILAGMPFLTNNDIAIRPAMRQIVVHGSDIIHYGESSVKQASGIQPSARRTQCFVLKAPARASVILPGDFVELSAPKDAAPDDLWAIEPRFDTQLNNNVPISSAWPVPQIIQSVDGHVRLTNNTSEPICVKKYEHLCQARPIVNVHTQPIPHDPYSKAKTPNPRPKPFSSTISVDPQNNLTPQLVKDFRDLHHKYDHVFDPAISKYNGASGKIQATVNMGPSLPPQRKGRLPQYNRHTLQELQAKFDELEEAGVFAKPDEVDTVVEYLNISFLVRKPNGGTRLVTSFGEVASYSKPQPSLMPNVDTVLRDIARWKYIIKSDLHSAFYQIPLAKDSRRFCGVATPFKGIRVYMRSAMGMPGSETSLEEVMSRVIGDLIEEGCVAKLADDLYVGGNTPVEILHNWERVLARLSHNNLRLSASKTVICPTTTTILGWLWKDGTISASPHRISALSAVQPPTTVKGLRSFIGAYKVLSRVLRGYAELMQPLESIIAGCASRDKITWSDDTLQAFKLAQSSLANCKTISLPQPQDVLWIVTDASVKCHGIGATLYSVRDGELRLCGFFNAKLKKHQVTWLPCETEALCIGAAVRHFSPLIIQSQHQCHVLTDSKPCVQAYQKLNHGEFSTSARVSTFLSLLSRYQIHVRHIAGVANLPADYTSRNPTECPNSTCQVCKFTCELQDCVVSSISIKDVTDGKATMPFTNRTAWLATQHECPDMRRTCAHLKQGTRPNKKATRVKDVKRYLNATTLSRDGLLVSTERPPLAPTRERIAIPRTVLSGLLTILHIRFSHPSKYQLRQLFTRYFFALDIDHAIDRVNEQCHHCQSIKTVPPHLHTQSSEAPPSAIARSFAADVMRRHGQFVLLLRETVSSFTATTFLDSESAQNLKEGLLVLLAQLQCLQGQPIEVRTDSAPGLQALANDAELNHHHVTIVFGRIKNANKNPVAEHAIQELGTECIKLNPEGGKMSKASLAIATATMNQRIRFAGLSAAEIWTQRDQITGDQLAFADQTLIMSQQSNRLQNHPHSATSKARQRPTYQVHSINIGDLVYLKDEHDKTKAREKYIIVSKSHGRCTVRKFVKSQFRQKSYEVPLCDCYPITPEVQNYKPHKPIRGLDQPSSDSEYENHSPDHSSSDSDSVIGEDINAPATPPNGPPNPDQPPTPPPIPPEIHLPPPLGVELPNNLPAQVQAPLAPPRVQPELPLRRSIRRRIPNTFLHNGDWQLSETQSSSDTDNVSA